VLVDLRSVYAFRLHCLFDSQPSELVVLSCLCGYTSTLFYISTGHKEVSRYSASSTVTPKLLTLAVISLVDEVIIHDYCLMQGGMQG